MSTCTKGTCYKSMFWNKVLLFCFSFKKMYSQLKIPCFKQKKSLHIFFSHKDMLTVPQDSLMDRQKTIWEIASIVIK